MTTCPSSIRKSPPSCSGDPYKSWPSSRLKLGQRVETSSSSSTERGSRTSTSERSFTSRSSEIVILCAKQTPTILFYEVAGCATGSARLLNVWCELLERKLRGRCPPIRVGLPMPFPERKGTVLSWSTWTPSSPHSTL